MITPKTTKTRIAMIVFFLIDLSDENGNVCDDDGDDDDDVIHVLADKE